MSTPNLAGYLQRFFTEHLIGQLGASAHTVASYRDTFRLLLGFATQRLKRQPSELGLGEFDAPFLNTFFKYLEKDRHNSARTRNNRLCAVHAFFRYVCLSDPSLALHCQRILAMPSKRYERGPVEFLSAEEAEALVQAPDPATWIGRRDQILLQVAIQTGLRNAEITSLRRQDVELGTGAHVRCLGKGRKKRCTPLRSDVASLLRQWLAEHPGEATSPVFPTARGGALSPDALQRLVARHVKSAARVCPSLKGKKITPHSLRHSAAMAMLRRGIDLTVIALWLGHESIQTTEIYLHADMSLKERALAYATAKGVAPKRYQPSDPLLSFLEGL